MYKGAKIGFENSDGKFGSVIKTKRCVVELQGTLRHGENVKNEKQFMIYMQVRICC